MVADEIPWTMLRRVCRTPGIVVGDPTAQVIRAADILLLRAIQRLEDVNIVHAPKMVLATLPLPNPRRPFFRVNFPLSDMRETHPARRSQIWPCYAKPTEGILRPDSR